MAPLNLRGRDADRHDFEPGAVMGPGAVGCCTGPVQYPKLEGITCRHVAPLVVLTGSGAWLIAGLHLRGILGDAIHRGAKCFSLSSLLGLLLGVLQRLQFKRAAIFYGNRD